jgi:hypothetical protein
VQVDHPEFVHDGWIVGTQLQCLREDMETKRIVVGSRLSGKEEKLREVRGRVI